MDSYTIFAIVMSVLGSVAMTLGVFMSLDAHNETVIARDTVKVWCAKILDEVAANERLRSKVEQALAQRIKDLETYRVNHAHRLNQTEDLIDLLNQDQGRQPASPAVVDPGVDKLDMEIFDVAHAPRSSCAKSMDTFMPTDYPTALPVTAEEMRKAYEALVRLDEQRANGGA